MNYFGEGFLNIFFSRGNRGVHQNSSTKIKGKASRASELLNIISLRESEPLPIGSRQLQQKNAPVFRFFPNMARVPCKTFS